MPLKTIKLGSATATGTWATRVSRPAAPPHGSRCATGLGFGDVIVAALVLVRGHDAANLFIRFARDRAALNARALTTQRLLRIEIVAGVGRVGICFFSAPKSLLRLGALPIRLFCFLLRSTPSLFRLSL